MVKITRFTAVNRIEQKDEGVSTTLEAEEAAVIELYENAIRAVLEGKNEDAEEAFRTVLSNDLVTAGTTEQLQRVRILSMKNLAIAVSKQGGRNDDAMILFQDAIQENPCDASLMDRFGTLAATEGEWTACKDAFIAGLMLDPSHLTMKRKLYDILAHLYDLNSISDAFGSAKFLEKAAVKALVGNLPSAIDYESQSIEVDPFPIKKIFIEIHDWSELLREVCRILDENGRHCLVRIQVEERSLNLDGQAPLLEVSRASCSKDPNDNFLNDGNTLDVARNHSFGNRNNYEEPKVLNTTDIGVENMNGDSCLFSMWKDFIQAPSANIGMLHIGHEDNACLQSEPMTREVPLQWCSSTEWPINILCEFLLIYYSGSDVLANLSKVCCECLIKIIEHVDHPLPIECTLTLTEWLIEQFWNLKEQALLGSGLLIRLEEEMSKVELLCKSQIVSLSQEAESFSWQSYEQERCFRTRFSFTKGKFMQVLGKTDEAKECLSECLHILGEAQFGIHLKHLNNENIITAPRVKFNLESVDIHSQIREIRIQPLEESGSNNRLVSLAEKVLSGQEAESFMLSVDSLGWSSILRELIDAAIKSNDYTTCIRCQIRLLFANLPQQDVSEILKIQKSPMEFLQPLFTTTFMNFIMNSVQLEKIIYCKLEIVVLDSFELDMLRCVLMRLLMIMDACHHLLIQNESHGKTKYCKVLLSHTTSYFLGLLRLESQKENDSILIDRLDSLFEELGTHHVLLHRNALVPYFALPFLRLIYTKVSNIDKDSELLDRLEDQMEHMLTFGFDVTLSANSDAGNFSHVKSLETYQPRRVSLAEELLLIWPLCEFYLNSLSNQMLKRRAGRFIEQCYEVAVSSLPQHVHASMCASIEKSALCRPGKVCSEDIKSPFSSFKTPGMLDPEGTMDAETREGLLAIFRHIFDLKTRIEPLDVQAFQRSDDIDVLRISDKVLEEKSLPYLWNLAFNNDSIEDWQALAEFHHMMYQWIMNTCLSEGRHPSLQESNRLLRHRNIAYWCSFISCQCADEHWKGGNLNTSMQLESASRAFEFHGQVMLEEVTRLKAGLRDRDITKENESLTIRENTEKCLSAFIGATRFSPSKYCNHILIGNCLKVLGHSPDLYISRLVHACKLAKKEHGALIDPLYELHASRMELLENIWDPQTDSLNPSVEVHVRKKIIDICSQTRFCAEHPSNNINEDEINRIKLLHDDTIEAMEWCLEMDKHYYKASIRLATSKVSDAQMRYKYLNSLFSRGTQNFGINIWAIREKGPHMQKYKRERKRKMPTNEEKISFYSQLQAEHDVLHGSMCILRDVSITKPKVKTAGIGMNDIGTAYSHNLFITHEALLAYIIVLKELQDFTTLKDIQEFLEDTDEGIFKAPAYQDIALFCRVCKIFMTLAKLDAVFPFSKVYPWDNLKSLSITFGMPPIFQRCDTSIEEQVELLKLAYELYFEYLSSSQESWMATTIHPVAKYMLWRHGEHDTSDDMFAKIVITKRGIDVLEIYACMYIKLLASLSQSDAIFSLYRDFLEKVEKKTLSLYALVSCMNALPHIDTLVRNLVEFGTSDSTSTTQTDVLARLQQAIQWTAAYLSHARSTVKNNCLGRMWSPLQDDIKAIIIPKLESLVHLAVQHQKRIESDNIALSIRPADALASIGFVLTEDQDTDCPMEAESSDPQVQEDKNEEETPKTSTSPQPTDNIAGRGVAGRGVAGRGVAAMAIRGVFELQ